MDCCRSEEPAYNLASPATLRAAELGEHHESSFRICAPRAGLPSCDRGFSPSSSRGFGGGQVTATITMFRLPATGVGSADTSTITTVIGGGPHLSRMPLIRCGRTGIRTSKLFDERRLRPALNDGSSGGGIIRLRLVSPRSASPNHDGVSELKGRRDVPQRLYCFPRPPNGERAKSKTRPKIDWLTSTLSIFAMLISVVSRCTSPVL